MAFCLQSKTCYERKWRKSQKTSIFCAFFLSFFFFHLSNATMSSSELCCHFTFFNGILSFCTKSTNAQICISIFLFLASLKKGQISQNKLIKSFWGGEKRSKHWNIKETSLIRHSFMCHKIPEHFMGSHRKPLLHSSSSFFGYSCFHDVI